MGSFVRVAFSLHTRLFSRRTLLETGNQEGIALSPRLVALAPLRDFSDPQSSFLARLGDKPNNPKPSVTFCVPLLMLAG